MKRLLIYAIALLLIALLVNELRHLGDVNGQLDGLMRRVG